MIFNLDFKANLDVEMTVKLLARPRLLASKSYRDLQSPREIEVDRHFNALLGSAAPAMTTRFLGKAIDEAQGGFKTGLDSHHQTMQNQIRLVTSIERNVTMDFSHASLSTHLTSDYGWVLSGACARPDLFAMSTHSPQYKPHFYAALAVMNLCNPSLLNPAHHLHSWCLLRIGLS